MIICFRDDDVGRKDDILEMVLRVFTNEKMVVNLAIIPNQLHYDTIKLINDFIKLYPDYIEVHQHGFEHKQYEECAEFPPSRDYNEVKNRLIEGDDILRRAFPINYVKILTPAWHQFDKKFLPILKELNYEGICTRTAQDIKEIKYIASDWSFVGKEVFGNYRIAVIDDLIKSYSDYIKIPKCINKLKNDDSMLVLLFHHHLFYGSVLHAEITFREFFKWMREHNIKSEKFSTILRNKLI